MKKPHFCAEANRRRWKERVKKSVIAHFGYHMPNERDFVAFIAAEIAESLDEEPP